MDFFAPLLNENCDLLEFVRNDIVLKKDTYYFDWTASGLESRVIARRIEKILPYYANTHSDTSKRAIFIMELYLTAKDRLRNILGLNDEFYIIPGGYGATGAMKRYQEILGLYVPPKLKPFVNITTPPLVIVGPYEHHSNEISLRESICKSIRIPLKNGIMDFEFLEKVLYENKDSMVYASINIASNVTGIIAPYNELSALLRSKAVNIAFDLATLSPHENIDSKLYDAIFLSPHKLLGGIGSCGILGIRKEYFDFDLPPSFCGGGSIKYATKDSRYYIDDIEQREDSGTPPILQILRASLAYQYRNEVGFEFIQRRERVLYEVMIEELKSICGMKIYGIDNDAKHLSIISFNIDGISPYDLAHDLSYDYGIEVRAGCSCAGPYGHDLLNIDEIKDVSDLSNKPSWIRISIHYSHNYNDIEYFIVSLKKVIKKYKG